MAAQPERASDQPASTSAALQDGVDDPRLLKLASHLEQRAAQYPEINRHSVEVWPPYGDEDGPRVVLEAWTECSDDDTWVLRAQLYEVARDAESELGLAAGAAAVILHWLA